MQNTVLTAYLGIGAVLDGRRKRLSTAYLWIGVVLAFSFFFQEFDEINIEVGQLIMRVIPGVLFLIYARLTKEKVGYGDGIMLLILGGCLSGWNLWMVWIWASFLSMLWAGLLLIRKKAARNTQIPFVPFLWTAHVLVWGMTYG